MKNYLIILFCFLGVQLIGQSQISFVEGTWEEVLEKAKEENKIIFVDVYATWCGPCKMMAKEVFTQQEVADFHNATFINAKFDLCIPFSFCLILALTERNELATFMGVLLGRW